MQGDDDTNDQNQDAETAPTSQKIAEADHDARGQRKWLARTQQAKKDRLELRNHNDHNYRDCDDGRDDVAFQLHDFLNERRQALQD